MQESIEPEIRRPRPLSRKLRWLILVLGLALSAIAIRSALAERDYYISGSSVDLSHLLAPPPAPDSVAGKADLRAVMDAQRNWTPAILANAQADAQLSVFRFADVIGPAFKPENLPFTAAFFERVSSDQANVVRAAKIYFHRPRPFVIDAEIKPAEHLSSNTSYPSGHATFAYVDAIILADMLPEKAAAIFARADAYAHNRVIEGVHYPTDLEAGRISAAVIDNVLLHDAHFMADYAKARLEIRHALGLQ
jgi:acid phosphatase (class A)